MSISHIKWTDSQKKQLSRAVSKFNAKLTRERRKSPKSAYYLPNRMSAKDLQKSITTRQELERLVKSVDRAFKPGAFTPITYETGVTTTKWELRELKLGVNRINKARAKILEKLPEAPTQVGAMGSIERNMLKPKEFKPESIKAKDWEAFVESVERQQRVSYYGERDQNYKNNYLRALQNELGVFGTEVADLITKMPASVVADGFLHSPFLNFDFVYSEREAQNIAHKLLVEWTDFFEKSQG